MKKIRQLFFLLICSCILLNFIPVTAGQAESQRTVKVGFFSSEGYHIKDEEGTMSGYGFDFLQMMLRYNNWTYEYVGYDLNWKDMLEMLDAGEIDLLTLADKTPERLEKYDYSEQPIGTSSTIMTKAGNNTTIVPGDYSTYENIRVGLVKNSSHNDAFDAYAKETGFSYIPVYYDETVELLEELQKGEAIDVAITSNMRVVGNETILDEFNAHDYYVMVKKGNQELLAEINSGIAQLDVYSQNWKDTLYKKYYANTYARAISFSPDERLYLQELKDENIVLKAAMNPELKPYSYFENGEAKGIAPKIFGEIADRLGLQYEILESKDRWEYKEQLSSGEAMLDLTAYLDYSLAQKYNLKETDAYMTSALAMLSRKDSNLDKDTMVTAVVRDPTEYIGYNNELIYEYDCVEYESIQECIDAVKRGEVDATFRYIFIAERAVREDYTNRLQYQVLQEDTFGLSIGVTNEMDHRLLSILNKGVNSLNDTYVQSVILEERAAIEQNPSFIALVYDHPFAFALIISFFCIMFLISVLLMNRNRMQKVKLTASMEMERFIGYVCESYETVAEINLQANERTIYELRDGKLKKTTHAYVPFDEAYFKRRVKKEDLERIVEAFSLEKIDRMISEGGGEQYLEVQIRDRAENDPAILLDTFSWYTYIIRALPKDQLHPRNYVIFEKNIQETKAEEENQKQILRDALENANKASRAKGDFVSKISHEIRTPLNAIIGYLNMAQEAESDAKKVDHYIQNGKIASIHLLELINDVLDNSAIESNKMKIAIEEFSLKELLISISSIYYNQTAEKGVHFSIELKNVVEENMRGDALRVKQILVNLLSNASKFTEAGGTITLTVEQTKQTENMNYIQFQVCDTGVGMSEEFLDRIFDAFEQEHAGIAQKYGGSGLGMSITKNLVDLMNGSIRVSSEKNEGTSFVVDLPFERVEKEEENPESVYNISKVRILAVETEKPVAAYLKNLFKYCGVKSDLVDTKEKALKKIKSRMENGYEYQICLMDWSNPDLDGAELIKDLKELCGENLPYLIALTYDAAEATEEKNQYGVDLVMAKPLFQSTLFDFLVTRYGGLPIEKKEERAGKKEERLRGVKVLLAEDNEMNMEIALYILTKAGMEITPACNGKEVCDIFLQADAEQFDAILMDIQMPEMNGYEATAKIRNSAHPKAKTIPIIALTANAFSEDVSKALNAGMNEHVSKPIDEKKLYKALRKFL